MKKYKFLVVFILLIGALSSDLFAQNSGKSAIEKLQKYNWRDVAAEGVEFVYEFSSEKDLKLTLKIQTDEKIEVFEDTLHYYLSDTMDKEFDKSKMGKNRNGDYLIFRNEKSDGHTIFRIVEITTMGFEYEDLKFKRLGRMQSINK